MNTQQSYNHIYTSYGVTGYCIFSLSTYHASSQTHSAEEFQHGNPRRSNGRVLTNFEQARCGQLAGVPCTATVTVTHNTYTHAHAAAHAANAAAIHRLRGESCLQKYAPANLNPGLSVASYCRELGVVLLYLQGLTTPRARSQAGD